MTSQGQTFPHLSRRAAVAASVALLALAGVAATAEGADAQSRSWRRSASVSGPHHSASRTADIYRSPGSATVSRSRTFDDRSWASSRSRVTVPTDSGYATTAIRTGPAGNTQTRTGEVVRDENGYSRSSDFQTSRGYGYARDVDVYRDEDEMVISRDIAANNGASRSSTVVRTRPD
jgi:hypothetical protein